ncbi:hypothetical protein BYT27DRAFT_7173212 [Phlegmacium glaucopus]|nr:hypothetical protein BYT27DRAFT_7173212 [Phlegmacium glaucopus]
MLSRLVDIPLPSAFNLNGVKWTVSGLILLSLFYTYLISRLTSPPLSVRRDIPEIKYLARAKQLQAARKAQRELEEERKRILESGSFRLLDLPPEISFLVLENCTDWPGMYLSLVLVSRRCQELTFHALLPHMPIRLIIPEQVHSFGSLLFNRPRLATLVHHLWVTPYKEDLLRPCVEIVKKCRNLKSLASNAYMVLESITFRGNRLSHLDCKDLTLLSTSTGRWASLLDAPNGLALFRQLTHLRLLGYRFPTDIPLPNLTHLSYGSDTVDINVHIGMAMMEDPVACPSLHTVIVTKLRASGGLRISRAAHSRFFTVELPAKRKELELWCDNVSRRGMWVLCADPLLQSSKE